MPTVIGVIFFCCGVYCFLLKEDSLLGLLVIAGIFQAASAINIAERGIQPYYVIALFVIVRAAINRMLGSSSSRFVPQSAWLLAFAIIAIASAFVLPIIFAGVPVYDPKVGIDDGLFVRPPLRFGLNNVAQAGFLACHIAAVYAVPYLKPSLQKARKAYIWAFYLVVVIIVAQSVCQLTGIPFPHSLILNNPGYALWDAEGEVGGTRNPGPFSEPSLAGGFLVMYCVGFLAQYLSGKAGAIRLIVSLAAIGLVASGGSLLALILIIPVLLACHFPFRFPWYIDMQRMKKLAYVVLILAAPLALALLASSGYRDALLVNTLSKSDSGSFINRTASDLYAIQLLIQTHWIGVGLGSNRASSLLPTLLSNVGVVGGVTFGVFYIKLFAKLPGEHKWLKWAGIALLLNMCIGIADVTIPILWLPILLAVQFSSTAPRPAPRVPWLRLWPKETARLAPSPSS